MSRRDRRWRPHRQPKAPGMAQWSAVLVMLGALVLLLFFRSQVAERLSEVLGMVAEPSGDLKPAQVEPEAQNAATP